MKNVQSDLRAIVPAQWRSSLDDNTMQSVQEIHLRLGMPPVLRCAEGNRTLPGTVRTEDLSFCVNMACRYSPWNAATLASGFLTAPGGHRIGLCGEATSAGIRSPTSVCIRVSRDLPGISREIPLDGDLLILGPPGSGKTTLLRDLIRRLSRTGSETVAVVDERCELFPMSGGSFCYDPGPNTDVLLCRGKEEGIDMVLRTMGPAWIATDEITAEQDCVALSRAAWCGVRLIATAHAGSVREFLSRSVYEPLVHTGIFHRAAVLHPDQSCHMERICL